MSKIIHIETISELSKILGLPHVKHPLATVVDFSKYDDKFTSGVKLSAGFYSIMFKNFCGNKIKYGQKPYDFQEGSLICIAPRQVVTFDEPVEKREDAAGWGLFFHPDLIRGTSLGRIIREYTFFSYDTNEALHLSGKEKQVLNDCVDKIDSELNENIDRHSQALIISNIQVLLNYCSRYYERQFITRRIENKDILIRVEELLKDYFKSPGLDDRGLPSVKTLADKVNLSPGYLSDLLKKETGMNAKDQIHFYLIEEAKTLLLSTNQSVSELAFSLGFEYPQYFSRLFKSKTGMTPGEFRNLN
jgi:AraC-like DNA-binding protein